MDSSTAMDILRSSMLMAAVLATPLLAVGLIVGFLVSLFQAVTQIQDQTVTAVPKILAIVMAMILFLPWMAEHIIDYTRTTYEQIPEIMRP